MELKTSEPRPPTNPLVDIVKKGSVITFLTLLSRPLGYIREAIQAYLFGATALVDAFIVAFNFPELIQTLFISGATSAFLVPVCTRYMKEDSECSRIFSTFINLSIIVTVPVSLLFFAFSGVIVDMIAPGFIPETRGVAKGLFLIMIPVISLHAVLSVIKAFLNAKEHFAAPEMSGIVWNIVFIVCALSLTGTFGIYSLAIGVTLGSLLQILIQVPYLMKFNISYRPILALDHPSVKEARNLFTGALIATSIVPINSFVDRIIASYLPQGEVASLSYAFRIFILPFSLFAVPVYTVMFSKLSRLYHEKDWKDIFAHTDSSMVLLCISLIPSTILLCATGDICIKILYERGAFTVMDTVVTNRALFGYSVGLLFYALSISFVRVFNAIHDMKTPAMIGITSIFVNAFLDIVLMGPLGNLGIALATSIASLYNFLLLFLLLRNRTGYRPSRKTIRAITKALVAGIILLISIFAVRRIVPEKIYISLSLSVLLMILVYGIFFKNYYLKYLRRG